MLQLQNKYKIMRVYQSEKMKALVKNTELNAEITNI